MRKRRQLFLTAFELGRLADESGDYAPLVWFLGWSGLRWGEAVALRVGRVNPKRRRVRVEESATEIGGRLVFGSTKTHETRTVIVPRYVMTRLAPLLEGKASADLVFTGPGGGPLRHSNFTRRVWRPAVAASGLPAIWWSTIYGTQRRRWRSRRERRSKPSSGCWVTPPRR